jgi:hypothetical protein
MREKKPRIRTCFTFCLPGRPKVNAAAHVALGCRARPVADVRFDHRRHRPASSRASSVPQGPAKLLRDDILLTDELVQWMVQDASLRR